MTVTTSIFGHTKQGAGQQPGESTLAKPPSARQEICVNHFSGLKLVKHRFTAGAQAAVIRKDRPPRLPWYLCQALSVSLLFSSLTASQTDPR